MRMDTKVVVWSPQHKEGPLAQATIAEDCHSSRNISLRNFIRISQSLAAISFPDCKQNDASVQNWGDLDGDKKFWLPADWIRPMIEGGHVEDEECSWVRTLRWIAKTQDLVHRCLRKS